MQIANFDCQQTDLNSPRLEASGPRYSLGVSNFAGRSRKTYDWPVPCLFGLLTLRAALKQVY